MSFRVLDKVLIMKTSDRRYRKRIRKLVELEMIRLSAMSALARI